MSHRPGRDSGSESFLRNKPQDQRSKQPLPLFQGDDGANAFNYVAGALRAASTLTVMWRICSAYRNG